MKTIFIFALVWMATTSNICNADFECRAKDILAAECNSDAWGKYAEKLSAFEGLFESDVQIKIINHYNAIPFDKNIDRSLIRESGNRLITELVKLDLWQAIKYTSGEVSGTILQLNLGSFSEGKPRVEAHLSKKNIFGYEVSCPSNLGSFYGACYRELDHGWLLVVRRSKA